MVYLYNQNIILYKAMKADGLRKRFGGIIMRFLEKNIGYIILISIICIITAPFLFTYFYTGIDFSDKGQIGDTIGGITAPFIGVISILLLYFTLTEQLKFNKQQKQIDYDALVKKYAFDRIEEYRKGLNKISLDIEPQTYKRIITLSGSDAITYILSFLKGTSTNKTVLIKDPLLAPRIIYLSGNILQAINFTVASDISKETLNLIKTAIEQEYINLTDILNSINNIDDDSASKFLEILNEGMNSLEEKYKR